MNYGTRNVSTCYHYCRLCGGFLHKEKWVDGLFHSQIENGGQSKIRCAIESAIHLISLNDGSVSVEKAWFVF